jgi:hypothetical protein
MSVTKSVIVTIIPKMIAATKSFRARSGLNLRCGLFLILRPNLSGFLSYQNPVFLNKVVFNLAFSVLPIMRQLVTEFA